ncbi:MAG: glycosyltransferase, partial [Planctomycetes bacterium]|nr:glycosyltransferase [Planctomycetota bacterium]
YAPNAYGLKWFGENVWPLILKELPDASVRIIGRIPEKNSFQDYPRFESLGFLPDTFDEFATWSAMIVPLHFGGGTRLKILDAFSKMCPVVSTSVGAHGLGVTDNRNVLLADDPASFARACIRLLQEPDQGQVLATDGWDFFEKLYTWEAIGPQIEGVVRKATGEDGKP